MRKTSGQSVRARLASKRGAAFLLAVYFASLMLLLLGGISLQRTNLEVRAAQVSRDLAQSYWVAEGGLDLTLKQFRSNTIQTLFAAQPAAAPNEYRCLTGNSTDAFWTQMTGRTSHDAYRICETDTPSVYGIEIRGAIDNSWQFISAAVSVRDSALTLTDALYAQDGVTANRIFTAAVDTGQTSGVSDPGVPAPPVLGTDAKGHPIVTSALLAQGSIATQSLASGSITIGEKSYLAGDIKLPKGADPANLVSLSQDSTLTGGYVELDTEDTELPRVILPESGATDLGAIMINGASSSQVLTAGTYTASSLSVEHNGSLTTRGPVTLYVEGPIIIGNGGQVLGEPAIASSACNPTLQTCITPRNLRIIAKPASAGQQVSITNNAIVGAAVYAPDMPMQMSGYPLVIGAVVAKSITVGSKAWGWGFGGNEDRATASILYDLDLMRQAVLVTPEEQMTHLRMYRVNQLTLTDDAGSAGGESNDIGGASVSTPDQSNSTGWWGGGGGCQVSNQTFGWGTGY